MLLCCNFVSNRVCSIHQLRIANAIVSLALRQLCVRIFCLMIDFYMILQGLTLDAFVVTECTLLGCMRLQVFHMLIFVIGN